MRIKMVNGMLVLVAESPRAGYELAELQRQAVEFGKTLNVQMTGESVAATIRLPDHATGRTNETQDCQDEMAPGHPPGHHGSRAF